MLTAAVMTATIGRDSLWRCMEGVQRQTYKARHYIVVDGSVAFKDFLKLRRQILKANPQAECIHISHNVGSRLLAGNRKYAACCHVVAEDVVFMCDDDNFYDVTHIHNLMRHVMQGKDWAFSLRKVVDEKGEYICDDNCESLGHYSATWNSIKAHQDGERNNLEHMVDTSAYAFRTRILQELAWVYSREHYGPDRTLFRVAAQFFPNFVCSNKYTLNYAVGSNALSVNKDFFSQGNEFIKQRFPQGLPWNEIRSATIL
jgi:hypothetical protein